MTGYIPAVDVVEYFLRLAFAFCSNLDVVFNPGDEMVLERPLN